MRALAPWSLLLLATGCFFKPLEYKKEGEYKNEGDGSCSAKGQSLLDALAQSGLIAKSKAANYSPLLMEEQEDGSSAPGTFEDAYRCETNPELRPLLELARNSQCFAGCMQGGAVPESHCQYRCIEAAAILGGTCYAECLEQGQSTAQCEQACLGPTRSACEQSCKGDPESCEVACRLSRGAQAFTPSPLTCQVARASSAAVQELVLQMSTTVTGFAPAPAVRIPSFAERYKLALKLEGHGCEVPPELLESAPKDTCAFLWEGCDPSLRDCGTALNGNAFPLSSFCDESRVEDPVNLGPPPPLDDDLAAAQLGAFLQPGRSVLRAGDSRTVFAYLQASTKDSYLQGERFQYGPSELSIIPLDSEHAVEGATSTIALGAGPEQLWLASVRLAASGTPTSLVIQEWRPPAGRPEKVLEVPVSSLPFALGWSPQVGEIRKEGNHFLLKVANLEASVLSAYLPRLLLISADGKQVTELFEQVYWYAREERFLVPFSEASSRTATEIMDCLDGSCAGTSVLSTCLEGACAGSLTLSTCLLGFTFDELKTFHDNVVSDAESGESTCLLPARKIAHVLPVARTIGQEARGMFVSDVFFYGTSAPPVGLPGTSIPAGASVNLLTGDKTQLARVPVAALGNTLLTVKEVSNQSSTSRDFALQRVSLASGSVKLSEPVAVRRTTRYDAPSSLALLSETEVAVVARASGSSASNPTMQVQKLLADASGSEP